MKIENSASNNLCSLSAFVCVRPRPILGRSSAFVCVRPRPILCYTYSAYEHLAARSRMLWNRRVARARTIESKAMRIRNLNRLIMLLGLLSALLLVPSASAATSTVQPPIGPPGTRFLFFANGFAADEPISIWLNAPDGRVLAAEDRALGRSSASGAATWTWTAPSDAPLGSWQMVGHGRRSGNEQILPFTIGPATPSDTGGQGQNLSRPA